MSSKAKTAQQMIDKMYHIYDENGVVAHSLTEDDFEQLYDATRHECEECEVNKLQEASY